MHTVPRWPRKCATLVFEPMLFQDFEGPHHVVGFVFEDVAVVEVFAGVAFEVDDDAGDGAGRALDDVFPAEFVGLGWGGWGEEAQLLVHQILEDIEGAAVENLEAHQVEVHGMGVFGLVDELPDLGGVEAGLSVTGSWKRLRLSSMTIGLPAGSGNSLSVMVRVVMAEDSARAGMSRRAVGIGSQAWCGCG